MRYDVYGIGNALIDLLVEVSDDFLTSIGACKGGAELVTEARQAELLALTEKFDSARLVSGGSVANSSILFSQLGGKVCYSGMLGDDRYGLHFVNELRDLGLSFSGQLLVDRMTGTCLVLITPDSERSMFTHLGAATSLSPADIVPAYSEKSSWSLIEGYLLANGPQTVAAAYKAAELAKKYGNRVAFSLSDAFVCNSFRAEVLELLKFTDLIFCNQVEGQALTQKTQTSEIFSALRELVPDVVMTRGASGVIASLDGATFEVPAIKCNPVDLTGAGDAFLGSFMYGVTRGLTLDKALKAGCFYAMKVITQVGARLGGDPKEYWEEALNS